MPYTVQHVLLVNLKQHVQLLLNQLIQWYDTICGDVVAECERLHFSRVLSTAFRGHANNLGTRALGQSGHQFPSAYEDA